MADLPDYYTQTAITEAEAASITGGLDANRPDDCEEKDVYLATDTHILYVCFTNGTWTGFDASILTQGILTLYANMVAGGYRLTGLGAPTANNDAARKKYVDDLVGLYLALAGGTMSGNIVMGGKKVTGLGAPSATNDALRYGVAEVRNAEIAAAAGIVYSKLTLTGSLLMADLATAIKNAAAGLVVLDASADVPLAQIPDTLTGKDADTLDGDELTDIEDTMDSKDAAAITGLAKVLTGSFTGDDTENRAIPHGLAAAPKLVIVWNIGENDDSEMRFISDQNTDRIYFMTLAASDFAVTAMTTTNFYVGNSSEYARSGNADGVAYAWIAIT